MKINLFFASVKSRFLAIIMLLLGFVAFGQTVENLPPGSSIYTVKCGVTSLDVITIGGGGGGGRSTQAGYASGGGGGGGYSSKTFTVSAGDTFQYQVGAGGSGGDSNKHGGDSWFGSVNTIIGRGGIGVATDTRYGGAGGTAGNGTINSTGGKGGDGQARDGEGWFTSVSAAGGGGGAGRSSGAGGVGGNGTFDNNGGAGGSSTAPGGNGGAGTGVGGNGIIGSNYGGGGGGGKRALFFGSSQNGGNGAAGLIRISYTEPAAGTYPTVSQISAINSNKGTDIGCNQVNPVTLSAASGGAGLGVSTLWYQGSVHPSFIFKEEWVNTFPYTISNATSGTVTNGNRTFKVSSTNGDAMIDMPNILPATFDRDLYRYVVIRYRVVGAIAPGTAEIFFYKGGAGATGGRSVSTNLATDNQWHIVNIDMFAHTEWRNSSPGDITGWRYDFASVASAELELDYIVLSSVPILENTNADDSIISVSPTDLSTTYGAVRIWDQAFTTSCGASPSLNQPPNTVATSTTLNRIDKTYNATGAWGVTSNWSPGAQLPTINNCVRIPATKTVTVDIDNAQAGTLLVENGGTLTINSGKTLVVNNGITNQGNGDNFVVKSDANLIQVNPVSNTGSITVERSVSNMNNIATQLDYVYWSSPVVGQKLKAFSPGTPWNRFFYYNEPNDYFYPSDSESNFVAAKGYAIQAEGNLANGYSKDYKFKGVPNNGYQSIQIQRSANTGSTVHGYNLVGNPYPSNIDFDVLYKMNSSKIYNTAWFWTNATYTPTQQGSGYGGNNYAVYNGTGGNNATLPNGTTMVTNGIVKVGQGFIIQARTNENTTSTLEFNNSDPTHGQLRIPANGTFYHRSTTAKNRFWVELVSPTEMVNTQLIGYISGATDAYEQDFDAESFGMSSDIFYSILNDKKLLIQGRSDNFSIDDVVPLGANIFSNGNYKIQLRDPEGIFETSQNIYLKDKLTGLLTNLSEGAYTFAGTKGITEGRFEIVYKPEIVLATGSTQKDELTVYRDGDDFVVRSADKAIDWVEAYDMSGRLFAQVKGQGKEVRLAAHELVNGVYVLKIMRGGEVSSKRILK